MKAPKICVLRIEGTNCELETALAFKRLGASVEIVHLKQLERAGAGRVKERAGRVKERERRSLEDYDLLVIPGGFSAGDYVRAGAILAARLKGALGREIEGFTESGKPVLGICNGFQVLVELGLLPGFAGATQQQAALTTNDSARFECRPTLLKHESRGNCVFTQAVERGSVLKMPCAHAEGKFVVAGREGGGREREREREREEYLRRLEENDQIVFRYVDPVGNYAGYPWNPNGSLSNIAGICNPEGNIFGLMPHPERAFFAFTDSEWTRARGREGERRGREGERKGEKEREGRKENGDGRLIFESVLQHFLKDF